MDTRSLAQLSRPTRNLLEDKIAEAVGSDGVDEWTMVLDRMRYEVWELGEAEALSERDRRILAEWDKEMDRRRAEWAMCVLLEFWAGDVEKVMAKRG